MVYPPARQSSPPRRSRDASECTAEVGHVLTCSTLLPGRARPEPLLCRMSHDARRFLEPRGVDPMLLDLEVQGFVVGAQAPRCLGLVPVTGLERLTDRLALGFLGGRFCDVLQRRSDRRRTTPACRRPGPVEQREVFPLNHTRSEEGGAAHDVAELPHVPRPGMAQK